MERVKRENVEPLDQLQAYFDLVQGSVFRQ